MSKYTVIATGRTNLALVEELRQRDITATAELIERQRMIREGLIKQKRIPDEDDPPVRFETAPKPKWTHPPHNRVPVLPKPMTPTYTEAPSADEKLERHIEAE